MEKLTGKNGKAKNGEKSKVIDSLQGKKLSLFAKAMVIVGRLEGSSKWPSDPLAVQKLKSAMLIKYMEQLNQQFQVNSDSKNRQFFLSFFKKKL